MNFKIYDILSMLIPGFLLLLVIFELTHTAYDSELTIAYTVIAFIIGYINNAISSWLEKIYFYSWGGNPAEKILNNQGSWKVKYYEGAKVREMLKIEAEKDRVTDDELFAIAMRLTKGFKRVQNFNEAYAFSRTIFTAILIGGTSLIIWNYDDWKYYIIIIPIIVIVWERSKQRGYYYVKEVLNSYLNKRTK